MKNPFRSIRIFYGETAAELKKAAWPTWPELRDATLVVIVGMALLGVFISVIDFSLYNVIQLLIDFAR